MREGWKTAKLGDVINIQSGFAFKSSEYAQQGHFLVRIGNVQSEGLSLEKPKYVKLDSRTRRFELNEGDVVTSLTGNIGRVALVEKHHLPAALNQRVARLTVDDSKRISWRFLYYFLTSEFFRCALNSTAHGVAQKNVSPKAIESIPISLPPLPEQKRIVAILDEAFAGIATAVANTEKNLANARELFESYLNALLTQRGEGWVDKALKDVCEFSSGGTPSKKNVSYWNGEIPWVSGRDMKSTQLSDSQLHVSKAAIEESATRLAPAGSLLVLVRGMGLAHGAQVAELMVPCAFNQDIKGIHPKPDLIPRFLVFMLRNQINASNNVLSRAAHGTLKINADAMKALRIQIRPYDEQLQVVAKIDTLKEDTERLESLYQQKLTALAELKQSLLQKAFSGELTAGKEASDAIRKAEEVA